MVSEIHLVFLQYIKIKQGSYQNHYDPCYEAFVVSLNDEKNCLQNIISKKKKYEALKSIWLFALLKNVGIVNHA